MQSTTTDMLNLLKVLILGVACLTTPKAIAESAPPVTANPTPTTILPSDPTLAEKRMEIRPFQVADSDSKEETQPAIATVESSSFNAQISSSASDLLPDEVKASKKAQNPIANLISLPFQNNTNFGVGSLDRTQNVLNIQPVSPVNLSKDWLLVTRTIVPVIYQPELPQGGGGTFGLGDINPQFISCRKLIVTSLGGWGQLLSSRRPPTRF